MMGLLGVKPLLGVIGVLVLVVGTQTYRLDRAHQHVAAFEVAVEQCAVTNNQNGLTIRDLELNTARCIAGREADERVFAEVETRWELERTFLKQISERTTEDRIEVYRDPTCADFAKIDIRALCPSLADGLWRQAQSYQRIRGGGEASSSQAEDTR